MRERMVHANGEAPVRLLLKANKQQNLTEPGFILYKNVYYVKHFIFYRINLYRYNDEREIVFFQLEISRLSL